MPQKKHGLYSRTWDCAQERAQLLSQHKHQAMAQQWLHPTTSMARGLSKVQLLWSRKQKALLTIARGENSSSALQGQQTRFESITHYSTPVVDNMAPSMPGIVQGKEMSLPQRDCHLILILQSYFKSTVRSKPFSPPPGTHSLWWNISRFINQRSSGVSEHCHSGHKRKHWSARGSPNILLVLRRVIWGARGGETQEFYFFFSVPEQIFCLSAAQTA